MIFAFVGYMGSGKTTIAHNAIAGVTGWQHIGFSDPMLDCMRALGVPESIIMDKTRWNDPLPVLAGRSLRYAMQTFGTEWGRALMHPDFWLKHGIERANNFQGNTFIDNVRFPNEFDEISTNGGILIALRRKSAVPTGEIHESEQHINQLQQRCHIDLYNDGSIKSATLSLLSIIQAYLASNNRL